VLSFLLATVVDIGCSQSARRSKGHHSDALPTDRPTDACNGFAPAILCHSTLPFFAKFFRTFWSTAPTQGCALVQILSPKILFDHGEYVSHNFALV